MIDTERQIAAIGRDVSKRGEGEGEEVAVTLRRRYDAAVEDVWEAITDPARLKRWFMPISGDLRVGGTFQLEGHAGGEIRRCEPPRRLRVTFGGETSFVELRLAPDGAGATLFELEHSVPLAFAGSGAGAFFVGPGWDGALLGLALYVDGAPIGDPAAMAHSPEVQEYSRQSILAWEPVVAASGTATAEEVAAGKATALTHYAPDIPATA